MLRSFARHHLCPAAAALALTLLTACGSPPLPQETIPATAPPETTQPAPSEPALPKLAARELYNAEGLVITATGMDSGFFGPEILLTVENASDKNLNISIRDFAANGYMISGANLYCDVAAGKKAKDTLSIPLSELEEAGIETLGEMAFSFRIADSGTHDTLAESERLTLTTDAAGTFTQTVDSSGKTVYDQDGIRVICQGLKQDWIWDGTLVFYMENNTQEPISVYAENVSLNGYMLETSLWADLYPGTRLVKGMYLLDLNLESLSQVETMEFTLRMVNQKTWREIETTDPITLNFG